MSGEVGRKLREYKVMLVGNENREIVLRRVWSIVVKDFKEFK